MTRCPVCHGTEVVDTVTRDRLPTMQNYVYRTREKAQAATRGQLRIAVCRTCGFAWNRLFEPSRLQYDAGYDNTVPSAVMDAYYREAAAFLSRRYELDGGLVLDVGCGNGAFLRAICRGVPRCRGLGVDPALDRDRQDDDGRISLLKQAFEPDLVAEPPSLVVCRHVLEHIAQPVEFLRTIRAAATKLGSSPCFFEVPDLRWSIENGSFSDFCYEHCNYFAAESLARTVRQAGFEPVATHAEFGSQYLWLEAVPQRSSSAPIEAEGGEIASAVAAYSATEADRIDRTRTRLRRFREQGRTIAVWGMATKGVLFSLLVDPDASLVDVGIDVNANKQGAFVPLTGHAISPPAVLQEIAEGPAPVVVVMNENYCEEIRSACGAMGIHPILLGMNGAEL